MHNERERTNCEEAEQLTKKLPSLVDRRAAHALVEKAYDESTVIDLDPDATAPFVRPSYEVDVERMELYRPYDP